MPTQEITRIGAHSFPAAPLQALLRARAARLGISSTAFGDRLGLSSSAAQRLMCAQLLTATQADRLACALGLHPSAIWPQWFG